MADFKYIMTLSFLVRIIMESISKVEQTYYGARILRYENKKEMIEKKERFYSAVKKELTELNENISMFNQFIRGELKYANFTNIPKVNVKRVKKIIDDHKGDYPVEYDENLEFKEKIIKHVMAEDSSASSLSRKNTILKLEKTLTDVKYSISNFLKEVDMLFSPFNQYEDEKFSKNTRMEINKAKDCFSIGLMGETVFIIGKILENLSTKYLILLKKANKINYKTSEIKKWDFETKINILKKEKMLTPNQYSKLMSVKWDRNIFGHPSKTSDIKQSMKDAKAMVIIGLNFISYLESKIAKI